MFIHNAQGPQSVLVLNVTRRWRCFSVSATTKCARMSFMKTNRDVAKNLVLKLLQNVQELAKYMSDHAKYRGLYHSFILITPKNIK